MIIQDHFGTMQGWEFAHSLIAHRSCAQIAQDK